MKAIILAAGMGTRLGDYTKNLPKGMLQFGDKSLIERQIETLRNVGIDDIAIIKGYEPDKIAFDGVTYFVNDDYANTNMVETLLCAREAIEGDVLICYSDILYEPEVTQVCLESDARVGVVYDTDFTAYWNARLDHPEDDSESFQVSSDGMVTELGTENPPEDQMDGRYVGLIRLSPEGCQDLLRVYDAHNAQYGESAEKWLNSTCFKKAYMTDMIQAMINDGVPVLGIPIEHGWLEFDTTDDYERYQEWLEDGTMERFMRFSSP